MMRLRLVLGLAILVGSPMRAAAHDGDVPSAAASANVAPSARPVAAVVDAFHSALKRGDQDAAAALLTEDVLIFESGGAERSKAEYGAEHLPADAKFAKATTSTITRRSGRAAGSVAWIASEGQTTGEFRGRKINSRTTETMLLTRVGDRWKIAHIHWSSAAVR